MKETWRKIPQWIKIVIYVILGVAGAAALGFLFGLVIQRLWNWLMPSIFSLREITYWEAVGIFILARLIFGSFGGSSHDSSSGKKKRKAECEAGDWGHYDEWWQKDGRKQLEEYASKKETCENPAQKE